MSRRCWSAVLLTLACLPTSPVRAQFLSDPGSLRHPFETPARWAEGLAFSHREAAIRFLAVAEEILALPDSAGPERTELLGEAQGLSDLLASLEEQLPEANTMVRETRGRLVRVLESRSASLLQDTVNASLPERQTLEAQARALEAEVEGLRAGEGGVEVAGPLDSAAGTLSALARVVADEFEQLKALRSLQGPTLPAAARARARWAWARACFGKIAIT